MLLPAGRITNLHNPHSNEGKHTGSISLYDPVKAKKNKANRDAAKAKGAKKKEDMTAEEQAEYEIKERKDTHTKNMNELMKKGHTCALFLGL